MTLPEEPAGQPTHLMNGPSGSSTHLKSGLWLSWYRYFEDRRHLFDRVDDGAGGRLQRAKRFIKFQWRSVLYRSHLLRLHEQLIVLGVQQLLDEYPHTLTRPLRTYLDSRLSIQQRVDAQLCFFDWAVNTIGIGRLTELYKDDGHRLWQHHFEEGTCEVFLSKAAKMAREGELELSLVFLGNVLERLAFSVIPAPNQANARCLWIGGIQGTQDQAQTAKALQQRLSKLRLSAVLILVLKATAKTYGLAQLYAVGDEAHVFSPYRWTLSKRRQRRYDPIWEENGARPIDQSTWAITLTLDLRAPEDVKSQKRAELKRKNAWRQLIFDQVCEQVGRLKI